MHSRRSSPVLVRTIASVLSVGGASGTALAQSAEARPGAGTPADALAEVVVTAQRRQESIQDVPLSIVALTDERLDRLQVQSFPDYMAYLPAASYTTGTVGIPGNSSVAFRGIATDGGLVLSGSLPTVGTYLDDQPITSIVGTVDLHVYDIARIEALAGPQGTLYGASSLAGTLRIITNKPDPERFSARYDLELNQILGHGAGGQGEGYVNVPLVPDRMAARVVGWYRRTGGFIDNVFRARTFPTSGITQRNDALVEDDHNTVDVYGMRAQLGIDLDENWTVTPSVVAQRTEWDGSFQSDDTKVGELKVAHYYPEFGRDSWFQVGGTITGRIADFEVTNATYFMNRRLDAQNDYSDYGFFYDLVAGSGAGVVNNAGQLIDPSQINRNRTRLKKFSEELRVASPQDRRARGVAGLFFQRQSQRDQNDYLTPGFADRLSVPGRPGQVWLTLQDRVDRDYAAFAQADFDATPDLTLTGGTRIYRFDNSLVGFYGVNTTYFGTGVRQCLGRAQGGGPFGLGPAVVPGTPCTNLGVLEADGSVSPKRSEGSGATWRANATYRLTPDNLVYVTASTGFRPGGINRAGAAQPFGADKLYNYELGFKNTLLDQRATVNLAVFWQNWKNVQVTYQPPGGSGVAIIGNVGAARSRGAEAEFAWKSGTGWSLSAAAAYVDAKLTQPFVLGNTITAPVGQRLPLTPRFKGNVIARYDWAVRPGLEAYTQLAATYVGARNPVITLSDLRKTGAMPQYETLDASIGLTTAGWRFELYGRNLTDSRGEQSRAARCNVNYCGPSAQDPVGEIYRIHIQPRSIGLRMGQSF